MTARPSVLVTGANSGIGKEIASRLARSGYDVAINYKVDAAAAEALVQNLSAVGGRCISVYADISVAAEVDEMFRAVLSDFGKLDALVNNAAVQVWKPLLEVAEADWDRVLSTNLRGCFLCTQRAARAMKSRRTGAIVNIGSGCNKVPFPNLSSYTASKGAIEMFTKSAALELGPFGIRVNCVAPGAIDTDRTKAELPDFAGSWAHLTPLRRIGTPADVAAAVEFLLSDRASFISGQTLAVDGGLFTQPRWPESGYNA
ncbi:MAG TPA: 3-oxoacyl-ACP reductase family protein [Candidatus Eisenbacteria bacterium]|jgi:NAD(P)-dependent dehydrogenase (short-subunit alcohol dehydrogenase family)|nr:3-oxoacyl-ACP reductase family protein [Candidatus Eisenbacteria bacterium]